MLKKLFKNRNLKTFEEIGGIIPQKPDFMVPTTPRPAPPKADPPPYREIIVKVKLVGAIALEKRLAKIVNQIKKAEKYLKKISAGGDAASLPSCYVPPPPKARAAGAQKSQGGKKK